MIHNHCDNRPRRGVCFDGGGGGDGSNGGDGLTGGAGGSTPGEVAEAGGGQPGGGFGGPGGPTSGNAGVSIGSNATTLTGEGDPVLGQSSGPPLIGEAAGRSHSPASFNFGETVANALASILGYAGPIGLATSGNATPTGMIGSVMGPAGGLVGQAAQGIGLTGGLAGLAGQPTGLPGGPPTASDPSPSLSSIGTGPGAPGAPSAPGSPGGVDTPSLSVADNSGSPHAGAAIPTAAGVTGGAGGGSVGGAAPASVSGGTGSSFNDMLRRNMMLSMLSQGRVNT